VLKITIDETSGERRWILQGRLVAVWVDELRKSWKSRQRGKSQCPCVIDLNNVTFIDKRGERLLRTMSNQGAQFVATGVYIRHVLEQITTHGKPHLSRLLSCLFAGFVATVLFVHPERTNADPLSIAIESRIVGEYNAKDKLEMQMMAAKWSEQQNPRNEAGGALQCYRRL
jgi:hypothetical protein